MATQRPSYETDSRKVSTQEKRAIRAAIQAHNRKRSTAEPVFIVGAGAWKHIAVGSGFGRNHPYSLQGALAATGATTHGSRSRYGNVRVRKTQDIWVVQSNYGYGQGWEDSTAETSRAEGIARLREYRANQPEYPHRIIKRRERIAQHASMKLGLRRPRRRTRGYVSSRVR